jgi:hypothetical protein
MNDGELIGRIRSSASPWPALGEGGRACDFGRLFWVGHDHGPRAMIGSNALQRRRVPSRNRQLRPVDAQLALSFLASILSVSRHARGDAALRHIPCQTPPPTC